MLATSAGSLSSHRPERGLRKSGMPECVLIPAPVSAIAQRAWRSSALAAARAASGDIAQNRSAARGVVDESERRTAQNPVCVPLSHMYERFGELGILRGGD